MTSNIAIINPNQYQSYQRRKRKKEGRETMLGSIPKNSANAIAIVMINTNSKEGAAKLLNCRQHRHAR